MAMNILRLVKLLNQLNCILRYLYEAVKDQSRNRRKTGNLFLGRTYTSRHSDSSDTGGIQNRYPAFHPKFQLHFYYIYKSSRTIRIFWIIFWKFCCTSQKLRNRRRRFVETAICSYDPERTYVFSKTSPARFQKYFSVVFRKMRTA